MHILRRVCIFAGIGLTVASIAAADIARASEKTAVDKAFDAAKSRAWDDAQKYAAAAKEPLAEKIIEWLRYQQPDDAPTFASVARFIDANKDWPRLSRLRRTAEAVISTHDDAAQVGDWFHRYPPLSGAGALAHLDALLALGKSADVRALAPRYWREFDFDRQDATQFQRKFGKHLAKTDHLARLDRLIWDQQYGAAQHMLPQVDTGQAALARARLALMRRDGGVDSRIAQVPAALRDAPELQYERLRWRRRADMDQSARELVFATPPPQTYQEQWAVERLILARRALADGHYSEARRLVAEHGLSEGGQFAEAEFLAGWISLTFLAEPAVASQHFKRLFDGVNYPISRARGAYWAGRAADANGDKVDAERWWRIAAEFPATFYGQQAAAALGQRAVKINFAAPAEPPVATADFAAELFDVVRFLTRHDQQDLIVPFLRQLADLATTLDQRFAIIGLANAASLPHEAVRIAKDAAQTDNVVPAPGYPLIALSPGDVSTAKQQKETPLILALIRQESAFNPRAVSRAGARGMMQLLPATAQQVARATGHPYSRDRLLDDPYYNIQLGTAYFDTMLERYDQTPALALAAYNAGPSRVSQWIRQFGDPRAGDIALIDWIESIPFNETRNYVQRVLESEIVYRALVSSEQLAEVPDAATREVTGGARP